MIQEALALLPNVPPEVRMAVLGSVDAVRLAYFLGSILNLGVEEEQKMLEANTADELLRLAHTNLARELEILQLRSKIASEAQTEMDKAQRDYVLRQQMRAIQKELGEDETGEAAETELLRERLEKAELPEEVRDGSRARVEASGTSAAGGARLSRHSHVSRVHSGVAVAEVVGRQARSG